MISDCRARTLVADSNLLRFLLVQIDECNEFGLVAHQLHVFVLEAFQWRLGRGSAVTLLYTAPKDVPLAPEAVAVQRFVSVHPSLAARTRQTKLARVDLHLVKNAPTSFCRTHHICSPTPFPPRGTLPHHQRTTGYTSLQSSPKTVYLR